MNRKVTLRRQLRSVPVQETLPGVEKPSGQLRLWLIEARRDGDWRGTDDDPWEPWYDKNFGFVIRAATEGEAREIAYRNAGDETRYHPNAWTNPDYSTCKELLPDGEVGMIIHDGRAA